MSTILTFMIMIIIGILTLMSMIILMFSLSFEHEISYITLKPDYIPAFSLLHIKCDLLYWSWKVNHVLLDFSLTVKAATLIFISRRGLAISSAKQGKSGFIYKLVKSQ